MDSLEGMPQIDDTPKVPTRCYRCPIIDSLILEYVDAVSYKDQIVDMAMDEETLNEMKDVLIHMAGDQGRYGIDDSRAKEILGKIASHRVGFLDDTIERINAQMSELIDACDGLQEARGDNETSFYYLNFCGSKAMSPYMSKQPAIIQRIPKPGSLNDG